MACEPECTNTFKTHLFFCPHLAIKLKSIKQRGSLTKPFDLENPKTFQKFGSGPSVYKMKHSLPNSGNIKTPVLHIRLISMVQQQLDSNK